MGRHWARVGWAMAWGLSLLGTACDPSSSDGATSLRGVSDRASNAASNVLSGVAAEAASDAGGNLPPATPASEETCPAARRPAPDLTCASGARWARDPESGACCEYANDCEGPAGWPVFESAVECETSCRCASFDFPENLSPRLEANLPYRTERISLDCECPNGTCSDHVDQLTSAGAVMCGWSFPQQVVVREQGCGMISLRLNTGYGGTSAVFDAASGALIGRSFDSDSNPDPCQTYSTIAGTGFSCESAQTCLVCGQWFSTTPAPPPCD